MQEGREERVRARAHEIWEAEGRPEGREAELCPFVDLEVEPGGLFGNSITVSPGDWILLKASRGMRFERVLEAMRA